MIFSINSEVIDLHLEVHLLVTFKADWLAVGGGYPGPNLHRPDYEVAGSNVLGGNRLHLVGQNQRGRHEALIPEIRYLQALAPGSLAVAVNVLHDYIEAVVAGPER